jgi:hypothetical protein
VVGSRPSGPLREVKMKGTPFSERREAMAEAVLPVPPERRTVPGIGTAILLVKLFEDKEFVGGLRDGSLCRLWLQSSGEAPVFHPLHLYPYGSKKQLERRKPVDTKH